MHNSKFKWLTAAFLSTVVYATAPHALANSTIQTTSNASFKEENYEANTLVVQYKTPLTYNELSSIKGVIIQQLPSLKTSIIRFKNEDSLKNAVDFLSKTQKIEKLSLSPKYNLTASIDDKADEQYIHTLLNTNKAYKSSNKKKVKIAVIDTGIDTSHPDLKGKIVKAINSVDSMKKQVKMAHGTHVTGIIAANKNNTIGGYGVYPNAAIYSYDVFNGADTCNDFDVANAILQATKDGVSIINMSLGGYGYSTIIENAITKAHAKGITVIAAAGNDNTNDTFYPAALENVISVGSTNASSTRSSFSNYGSSLDVVAPGENIYSTSYEISRGSSFDFMSGTSMASPITTSTAALLISKNKKITPNQIEYVLQHTAKDKGTAGYDMKYGAGLIQPATAVSYKLSKVPSLNSSNLTDQMILSNAETVHDAIAITDKFTKPNETIWKKIAVKKGQYVQVTATPSTNYDIKLTVKMLGNSKSAKTINDAAASVSEGGYIKATADGYIAVGIKDVNGHIHAAFSLETKVLDDLKHDESSIEKPIHLAQTNSIINKLYMNENDSMIDEDVLKFTATAAELIQVHTSGLPGVDLAIEVYKKEDLVGTGDNGPVVSINKNGSSEEEYASFLSEVGTEYYIVISNSTNSKSISSNDLNSLLEDSISQPKFSLLPYSVAITGKKIDADEDKIKYDLETSSRINVDKPEDAYSLEELFTQFGRPFDLQKGIASYLQGSTDIDGYYFKTKKSGFYEFIANVEHSSELPSVTIYEVDEAGNEQFVSSNSSFDGIMSKKAITSLKENTNYLLEVSSGSVGSIPQNGYEIKANLVAEDISDSYENNDVPEKAKVISANKTYVANFSKNNDIDFYYFKAKSNGIYQLRMATTLLDSLLFTNAWDNRYTKSITLYKDINHNKKMDDADLATLKALPKDLTGGTVTGSIEVRKDDTYFISTAPEMFSTANLFSIHPYELSLKKATTVDEDKKNKVTKNKPSKPIKLKMKNNVASSKKGYMNPGYTNGDADWYSFKAIKTKAATMTVNVPESMDAVIQVYAKGKLVQKIDYYGEGDTEIGHVKLKKNTTYYVKITDKQGSAFVDPYELVIK